MKNTSSTLLNNLTSKTSNKRLIMADLEFITDEFAHQIRGGDKYYTPMYETESNAKTRFFSPSILLES